MPYLNWKKTELLLEQTPHPKHETQLKITLGTEQITELCTELEPVFVENPNLANPIELRLELPSGWTLYWKLKSGSSRMSLAHPQPQEWVAAVIFNPAHAQKFLAGLKELKTTGQRLILSGTGTWTTFSNFDLFLEIR